MNPDRARAEFAQLADLARACGAQADALTAIAAAYRAAWARGGTVFFAGNGGSAADAQHLAAEYVVRFARDRAPRAALALTTDSSVLTAGGNDLGFEQVFARQVEALAREGDVLVLHSTSGRSPNLLAAARSARSRGVTVVGFLGRDGGELAPLVDHAFIVPADDTGRIQELHLAAQHIIAAQLDEDPT